MAFRDWKRWNTYHADWREEEAYIAAVSLQCTRGLIAAQFGLRGVHAAGATRWQLGSDGSKHHLHHWQHFASICCGGRSAGCVEWVRRTDSVAQGLAASLLCVALRDILTTYWSLYKPVSDGNTRQRLGTTTRTNSYGELVKMHIVAVRTVVQVQTTVCDIAYVLLYVQYHREELQHRGRMLEQVQSPKIAL